MVQFFSMLEQLLASGQAQVGQAYEPPLVDFYDMVPQPADELAMNLRFAAETDGDVLELACGTGRVTIPLAHSGHRVVGLDLAPAMLEVCRAKAASAGVGDRVELVCGDMCHFDLGRRFSLILIPLGSIIYIGSDEDRLALFRSVARHLEPGGRFVFSALAGEVPASIGPFLSQIQVQPETGALWTQVVAMRRLAPDCQEVGSLYTEVRSGAARALVTYDREYVLSPDRLSALLQQAGLVVQGMYSDFACTKLEDGAEDLIVVAAR